MSNGRIIGQKNRPEFFRGNGIWYNNDIGHWIKQGRWFFNRNATSSTTNIVEGETVSVTLTTVGIPDNTYVFWTTNTISGIVTTQDFTDLELTGYGRVINNTLTVTRKVKFATSTSGTRQFTIAFRVESIEGPIVASSPVITMYKKVTGVGSTGEYSLNGYRYIYWRNSGSIILQRTTAMSVFLVAGGGGGGTNGGGGGGGGGVVTYTPITITTGTHPVYVGGGGAAAPNSSVAGSDGGASYIPGYISATGGGGGGSRDGGQGGRYGGSGGGGGGGPGGGGGGAVPGQGNGGGNGYDDGNYSAGGGGGGRGAGGASAYRSGGAGYAGAGGAGAYFDPSENGTSEPYAGGGGGARTYYGYSAGSGIGQGIGTGGGGYAGTGGYGTPRAPVAGDSGLVFVKYLIPT